ncbi:N-acetylmuramoyl-L-alanine amidase [Streptomyces coeruleoprunus]|uniref:N-acetylmuramoyl-L-alanine amidase n=1 Tax=Streptomyces coeruleoprunus TaxID=285563 RepID=A0ABV9XLF7_9ACTN
MSPRVRGARRRTNGRRKAWLAVAAVAVGGAGIAVAAVAGAPEGNAPVTAAPDDRSRPVAQAHVLALDGEDPRKRTLPRTETKAYSMLGVSWTDGADTFDGTAQVRTRSATTGTWSAWRDLDFETRAPETAEGTSGARGASEPLWVGRSDGVEVRVVAADGERSVPKGLRIDFIDPGEPFYMAKPSATASTPASPTPSPSSAPSTTPAPVTPSPSAPPPTQTPTPTPTPSAAEPSVTATATATASPTDGTSQEPSPTPTATATDEPSGTPSPTAEPSATPTPTPTPTPSPTQSATPTPSPTATSGPSPTASPQPTVVARAQWGADESLVADPPSYIKKVDAVFVHHTTGANDYTCAEAPAIIRSLLTYHVKTQGWNDLGYNFLVDKCGTVYEGRAGGVARPVQGAHTYGFNSYSSGIALIGDYENGGTPTAAAKKAIADIAAWKLGLYGVSPTAKVTLVAAADTGVWKAGQSATLNTVSGHRDGYATLCPGANLYSELPTIRTAAAGSAYAAK